MVNSALLSAHAGQYKLTKDTAAEYYRQLFTLHPEVAQYYDAEDIDPDAVVRSQKFIMMGQQEMQNFFRLPQTIANDRQWRSNLANFKESFDDVGFPLSEFNKVGDAFISAMEKHAGGVSGEQKKEWEALFTKAYADMKGFGWY